MTTTTTAQPATTGNVITNAFKLINVALTRGINVTDNTLAGIEDASAVFQQTCEVAQKSNQIWATTVVTEKQAELDALMADIEAKAS